MLQPLRNRADLTPTSCSNYRGYRVHRILQIPLPSAIRHEPTPPPPPPPSGAQERSRSAISTIINTQPRFIHNAEGHRDAIRKPSCPWRTACQSAIAPKIERKEQTRPEKNRTEQKPPGVFLTSAPREHSGCHVHYTLICQECRTEIAACTSPPGGTFLKLRQLDFRASLLL